MTSTKAPHEKRPWAFAIDYWLRELKLTQAELVRRINQGIDDVNAALAAAEAEKEKRREGQPKKGQAKKLPRFGTNTMSRIARGHHTHTRKLELIAAHLPAPFEDVLVSPLRRGMNEKNRQFIRESVENVLRQVDVGGVRIDEATIAIAKRLQDLDEDLRASVLGVVAQYEDVQKKRRSGGGNASSKVKP